MLPQDWQIHYMDIYFCLSRMEKNESLPVSFSFNLQSAFSATLLHLLCKTTAANAMKPTIWNINVICPGYVFYKADLYIVAEKLISSHFSDILS